MDADPQTPSAVADRTPNMGEMSGEAATPRAITQPLNLRSFLRTAPSPGFDFVAVIDLIVIGLFLGLNSSKFLFAPGITVELPRAYSTDLGSLTPSAVLTVGKNELMFFRGQKIPAGALEAELREFVQLTPAGEGMRVLLLKADADLSMNDLISLFDIARRAGFDHVELAAVRPDAAGDPFQQPE